MNIFYLDKCPVKSAQYQVDKHVIKLILESAQLLCNCFDNAPYKRTHYNHPCSKWVRQNFNNYSWLLLHLEALCKEYTFRYNKIHKCEEVLKWLKQQTYIIGNNDAFIPPPQCMPDIYKNNSDTVHAYRQYYWFEKKSFASWKHVRGKPFWWVEYEKI